MVVRRTKKVRRQRGSRAHGWGVIRDHKGAGMGGGKGNAGVTTHKWIQTVIRAETERRKIIGKYGFKRPQEFMKKYNTVNVSQLDQTIDTLVSKGRATQKGKSYQVNLSELGITKLLAQGNVVRKINITVERATDRAVSKIEGAGGKVTFLGS